MIYAIYIRSDDQDQPPWFIREHKHCDPHWVIAFPHTFEANSPEEAIEAYYACPVWDATRYSTKRHQIHAFASGRDGDLIDEVTHHVH